MPKSPPTCSSRALAAAARGSVWPGQPDQRRARLLLHPLHVAHRCSRCATVPRPREVGLHRRTTRNPNDPGANSQRVFLSVPAARSRTFAFDPVPGGCTAFRPTCDQPVDLSPSIASIDNGSRSLGTSIGLSGRPTVCRPTGSRLRRPAHDEANHPARARQRGLSLVEMMVGITVGLFVVAAPRRRHHPARATTAGCSRDPGSAGPARHRRHHHAAAPPCWRAVAAQALLGLATPTADGQKNDYASVTVPAAQAHEIGFRYVATPPSRGPSASSSKVAS